jgi:uncharacterized protein
LTRVVGSRNLKGEFLHSIETEGNPPVSNTATTYAAREHARAQAGLQAEAQPTVPASSATDLPTGVDPHAVIWDETVAGGGYSSRHLPRGAFLRLTDIEGDACANIVIYNARETAERLNPADTVKVQWQAYLGKGSLLLSDMGRVLMTMVDDTSGRHDALCGFSTPASNTARYGDGSNHSPSPSTRGQMLMALAKDGMARRDASTGVTLFKGTRIDGDGKPQWIETHDAAGCHVTLRAEMDVLVVVVNTPHRLDPRHDYTCTRLRATAWSGPPTAEDDEFRSATPEGERAFQNTDDWFLGQGARG